MVSVDCIRVGDCQSNKCIFTSGENVILSFLREYSLFLDNFFFKMKDGGGGSLWVRVRIRVGRGVIKKEMGYSVPSL